LFFLLPASVAPVPPSSASFNNHFIPAAKSTKRSSKQKSSHINKALLRGLAEIILETETSTAVPLSLAGLISGSFYGSFHLTVSCHLTLIVYFAPSD